MRQFFLANEVPQSKLHFIPYGTDVKAASGDNGNPKPDSKELIIGYIGRLDEKKGVHILCEAVSHLPKDSPVRVKIFGPTDTASVTYMTRLRSYADRDSRIEFMGKLIREDMIQVYNHIDVLVVPSIWYENSPITITEALALKCPVVCSATAGMTDLIEDDVNGLTFKPGDVAALANCLTRLLKERQLLARLRDGIKPMENYDQVAAQLEQVYKAIR